VKFGAQIKHKTPKEPCFLYNNVQVSKSAKIKHRKLWAGISHEEI
jgi:hypothetical protein